MIRQRRMPYSRIAGLFLAGLTVALTLPALAQESSELPAGELVWGGFTGSFSAVEGLELRGDGWPPIVGSLVVDGAEIAITLAEPMEGCAESGRYAFDVDAGVMHLRLVDDGCEIRRMILDNSSWRPAGTAAAVVTRSIERVFVDQAATLPEPGSAEGSWPSFRGPGAAGVAEDQDLPGTWNGETGNNVLWRQPIPGLGHSSPVVWGDRVYVASAISSDPQATFRPGLYGDGDASADRTVHRFMVFAFDKRTGEPVWERVAYEGEPIDKRHVKSTYASSSPATDGRVVVAWFGSQGLYAWDVDGRPLWSVDVGRVDLGAYDIPSFEWGPASSPLLWNGRVFLQLDTQADSWMLAFDAASGELLWKTERDELPSWGTPNVVPGPNGPELVTNAPNFIRAYDPMTGEELWRLGGSSRITAPTPIFTDDEIVVASGRRPERPIFAVRPGARGDITLAAGETSNEAVIWSLNGRGPYMPTPLAYDGILYVLGNNGVFDAYDIESGEEIYRSRIPHLGSGFSASPVAADGRIYLSNEDGDIVVVGAGREFEHLATNPMGELLMATPALSDGVLYVRSAESLFAVGTPHGER
jgi:outer membrane protein assembly factor BamB